MSLVEMLVSILILGFMMLALVATSVQALAKVRGAEARVRATALVSELLETSQAIPFRDLGFFTSPDAPPAGNIILGATRPTATTCAASPATLGCRAPLPQESITRDGRAYTVTRRIVWVNNTQTSSAQDYKQITVTVAWTDGTATQSQSTQALRAPTPDEQQAAEFVLSTFSVTPNPVQIDASGSSLSGTITLRATLSRRANPDLVRVTFLRRGSDTPVQVNLTTINGTEYVGTATGPWRNGDTKFEFLAQRPSSVAGQPTLEVRGETFVRFLQPLEVLTPVFDPPSASIPACQSALAPAVTVRVKVNGTVQEDRVVISWPGATSQQTGTAVYSPTGSDQSGAAFTFTIPQGSYTQSMVVGVTATRVSDELTVTAPATGSEAAFTFTLHRPEC